jgi:hypothetical protein
MMAAAIPCPQRCFLASVDGILQDEREYPSKSLLRLMGVAVSLEQKPDDHDVAIGELLLDDGTAMVSIVVPSFMMERFRSAQTCIVGATLDCVVYITQARDLMASQVAIIEDVHAETLRWFELSFRAKLKADNTDFSDYSMECGYPSRAVTGEDLYELIQFDSSCVDNGCKPQGVAMNDLAQFFELDPATTEALIQELQISGQIYRNQQGLFLPL